GAGSGCPAIYGKLVKSKNQTTARSDPTSKRGRCRSGKSGVINGAGHCCHRQRQCQHSQQKYSSHFCSSRCFFALWGLSQSQCEELIWPPRFSLSPTLYSPQISYSSAPWSPNLTTDVTTESKELMQLSQPTKVSDNASLCIFRANFRG